MNTVTVYASKTYEIYIGSGVLSLLAEEVNKLGKVQKLCIVSDDTVFPLWGNRLIQNLTNAGYQSEVFLFPAGEASKNTQTWCQLLNFLAEKGLTRSDLVIALGGGVVGDLAGFAAASYLRGIRYIQIPTTLLAAVDSSVGGKTAIDLAAGKNLAGAFWQPSLVLCDTDLLDTLPKEIFRDGCAEVIKYAILYDPDLFSHLQQNGLDFDQKAVITRCIELKRDVVCEDEFDTGARLKLNFGHTVGHGVEAKSQYAISHGNAVAIGMAIISRSAAAMDFCSKDCCTKILNILKKFELPTTVPYSASELYAYTLSDKKRSGGTIRLIMPSEIGQCEIVPTSVEYLKKLIQAGL